MDAVENDAPTLLISLFRGVEATRDGRRVGIGGPRQRAVLALLAHRPRTVVSMSSLIDGLWGDNAPVTAVKTLRAYLSRLRSALGDEVIRSAPAGYLLDVPDDAVDVVELERCIDEARALGPVEPDKAASLLRDALEKCPAPALEGTAEAPGVAALATYLEQTRLSALELLMDLEVALGRGADTTAQLESLVAAHPYRERLWAALMRALYRSGRHADALAAYGRYRLLLDEDLGLEPGPDLRELEAAILVHEPDLTEHAVPILPRHLTPFGERHDGTRPETLYAKTTDGVYIAYQVIGSGPRDLVFFGPPISHTELGWEHAKIAAFYRDLASFSRLIVFDKRGVGMSDPRTEAATLEERMDDVRAVMDDAGSESAVMLGTSDGGPLGVLMATRHPDRASALIFHSAFAKVIRAPDYEIGVPRALYNAFIDLVEKDWGGDWFIDLVIPSFAADEDTRRSFRSFVRHACSPGSAVAQFERNAVDDVRELLADVRVPTLVMHAVDERFLHADNGRYMAAQIPGARYLELSGADHLPYGENAAAVANAIHAFMRTLDDPIAPPS